MKFQYLPQFFTKNQKSCKLRKNLKIIKIIRINLIK
nr:MAG TPA: hypothetical protein [Caudoviricetes sp.]